MKKLLALILAAALALSLVACGGDSGAGDTNTPSTGNGDTTSTDTPSGGGEDNTSPEIQELALGDTISTDNWEFTLTKVTFGTNLCKETESDDYMIVDGDYETTYTYGGETYNLSYVAEDGRAFVAVAYTMKYNGKETVKTFNQLPKLKVDYSGGYLFEDSPYTGGSLSVRVDGVFEEVKSPTIEPLSPAAEYRDCFDVPIEVMENADAPVKIIVTLDGVDYIYSVR